MKIMAFALFTILLCSSSIILDAHLFEWQFDKFKKLTFSYEQVTSVTSGLMLETENKKIINKLTGKLIIKVKSKDLADIIFVDLVMSSNLKDSLGSSSTLMTQNMPEMFIQDLRRDGKIDGKTDGQMDLIAKTMFPIMNKNAMIGDSTDIPLTVPFNLFGSTVNVKGYNRIKYAENKDGLDKLETIINVSEYSIPEEVKTKYNCYVKGNSRFDFNAQQGYFTNGIINMNMALGMEPADTVKSFMNMSMDMTMQATFKLIKVE